MSNQIIIPDAEAQSIADAKRLKRIKFITPFRGFLNGASSVFDGYYMTYFLTDIYKFPVAFTGLLSGVSVILALIFAPAFAAFSDRFRFKKSKFWPWPLMGSSITYLGYIVVMSLPVFKSVNAAIFAPVVFVILLTARLGDQISKVTVSGISPIVTKSPTVRRFLAQGTKIGHETGKTIFGYIVPLFIGVLASVSGNRVLPFAIAAVILFIMGWSDPAIYALFCIKGSYIEREGLKQAEKKERISLLKMLKVLFTNRPALGMFLFFTLHKLAFFIYVIYGISVYDHIFNQADAVGSFFVVFSVAAIAGVFCGKLWTRLFRESKRSCSMAMVIHIIFTAIIALTFNRIPISLFLAFFAVSSFFMGMLETWVTPLYTACAEYGNWKTGVTMNALVMSTYGLSVSISLALPPVVATILIRPDNYNHGLTVLFTFAPLVLAVTALLCFLLIFNLNDAKIRKIQKDLAEGKAGATSDLKL